MDRTHMDCRKPFPSTPSASRRGSKDDEAMQPKVMVSLGTVLIDCFQDGTGVREELGGGGLYAVIGARIWLPASRLGIGIDRGKDDFPDKFDGQLEHFEGPCEHRERSHGMWYFHKGTNRQTLKARIGYDGDARSFAYLSPPPHRTLLETVSTPLAKPSYLHLVASPEHTLEIVQQARDLGWPGTKLVLEPHPKHCAESDLAGLKRILKYLHVLSPNHDELLSLFSVDRPDGSDERGTRRSIETLLLALLDFGIGPQGQGCVVVRSGRLGACVGTRARGLQWVPAFYCHKRQDHVVDVTGAGNAFLGGFVAGLAAEDGDPFTAALYGSVSASFVVQQSGLPNLSRSCSQIPPVSPIPTPPHSEDGDWEDETWNGESPHERLNALRARISTA